MWALVRGSAHSCGVSTPESSGSSLQTMAVQRCLGNVLFCNIFMHVIVNDDKMATDFQAWWLILLVFTTKEVDQEFRAILGYRGNSRLTWAT